MVAEEPYLVKKRFNIIFITIWVTALTFFSLDIVFRFADQWMIYAVNYFYVLALISQFIKSDFLTEKSHHTEKLIQLKGYDIWGLLLIIIGATILLLIIGFKSSVIFVMAIVTFPISVWITIKYRRQISKSLIVNGLIIGGLSSIAQYNYIPSLIAIFIMVPFFFISACLLNERFPVTIVHMNKQSYSQMIKSFLVGCLFAFPMAISNLSDVIKTDPFQWIEQIWQPILVFNFVLIEETWVRLFMITFIYALVSSKTEKRFIPVLTAILVSSTIFGMTHYPQVDIHNCINIIILYGLPLGVLIHKRDFETVIGYHFIINFIGAITAFLNNNGIV